MDEIEKNLAIRDIADIVGTAFEDEYSVVAVKAEKIPPHTTNYIKIGVKAMNVDCKFFTTEEMILRKLMVMGGQVLISNAENEVVEIEVPVFNLGEESVNIEVGDVVGIVKFSEYDHLLDLMTEEEFDNRTGWNVRLSSKITVVDEDTSDPIAGASVTVWEQTVETDENGVAVFSNLTRGDNTVVATAEWYTDFEGTVDLEIERDGTITMTAEEESA